MIRVSIIWFMFSALLMQKAFSQGKISNYLDEEGINTYGFIVYDTSGSFILANPERLKNFELFTQVKSHRVRQALQIESPKVDLTEDKIVDLDSVLLHSKQMIRDYQIINIVQSYFLDSLHMSADQWEKHELQLSEMLTSVVFEQHGDKDFFSGLTYSNIVWYGLYGFQLVNQYNLGFSSRPLYIKLAIYQKNRSGKIKRIQMITSNQLI